MSGRMMVAPNADGSYHLRTGIMLEEGARWVRKATELNGKTRRYYDDATAFDFTLLVGEQGVVLTDVHGSPNGDPAIEYARGMTGIHPLDLRKVLDRAGYADYQLILAPCFPSRMRAKWASYIDDGTLYVIGDWDAKTIVFESYLHLSVYEVC